MRNASRIMIFLAFILITIEMVRDKIKEPSEITKRVVGPQRAGREKKDPVFVIDSVPETSHTFQPDSLLLYETSAGNDEHVKYIVQGNPYRIFLAKEKMVRSREALRRSYHLPVGTRIVEYTRLKDYPGRAIALWMVNPRVYLGDERDGYTCPEVTSGKGYYLGKTNISLLDEKNSKILNTVSFNAYQYTIGDTTTIEQCFKIPFAIGNPLYKSVIGGFKYHATGGDKNTDGISQILFMEDYNGDGKKLEFALYQQENCMLCNTTLFGYSVKKDSVINYDIQVQSRETVPGKNGTRKDTSYAGTTQWMEHLFCYKMDPATGSIEYDVDYRGRGGLYTRTKAKYDQAAEIFLVEVDQRAYLQNDSVKPAFYSPPVRIK